MKTETKIIYKRQTCLKKLGFSSYNIPFFNNFNSWLFINS